MQIHFFVRREPLQFEHKVESLGVLWFRGQSVHVPKRKSTKEVIAGDKRSPQS